MKVVVTGATGTVGSKLVAALLERGDAVIALSRDAEAAEQALKTTAVQWAPSQDPAPAVALEGADAVVNLLGEPLDRRWTDEAKEAIRSSRELGTRNLVAGIAACESRPRVLVSGSAVGYYGPRPDDAPVTEVDAAGGDFLATVVESWEREARAASDLGLRVALLRTGVILSHGSGALGKMLLPFKLGVGGPVAGGRQWMPWIHIDDVVGVILLALDETNVAGPYNVCAPEPVTNGEFSKILGRALGRPAFTPVPSIALKVLFGEMSKIVTTGQRAVPERLLERGFEFKFPALEDALADTLGRRYRSISQER